MQAPVPRRCGSRAHNRRRTPVLAPRWCRSATGPNWRPRAPARPRSRRRETGCRAWRPTSRRTGSRAGNGRAGRLRRAPGRDRSSVGEPSRRPPDSPDEPRWRSPEAAPARRPGRENGPGVRRPPARNARRSARPRDSTTMPEQKPAVAPRWLSTITTKGASAVPSCEGPTTALAGSAVAASHAERRLAKSRYEPGSDLSCHALGPIRLEAGEASGQPTLPRQVKSRDKQTPAMRTLKVAAELGPKLTG